MEGLQRSEISFRRQGSSGLVWDDKLLSGELNKLDHKDEADAKVKPINTSSGYRAGKVAAAEEPPSPRVSACGFCGAFGKRSSGPRKNRDKTKTAQGRHRAR